MYLGFLFCRFTEKERLDRIDRRKRRSLEAGGMDSLSVQSHVFHKKEKLDYSSPSADVFFLLIAVIVGNLFDNCATVLWCIVTIAIVVIKLIF